jgi:TolA-binding protein
MSRISSLAMLSSMLLALAGAASPQQIHLPPAVSQSQGMSGVPVTSGDTVQRQQAMAANLQRQAEIRRDSEKMFELTHELNDYLQKSDDATMSADALKKAEQIEKLAKSVRSKMKQSF